MSNKQLRFIEGDMVEYEVLPLVDQYDLGLKKPCEPVDFEQVPGAKVAYMAMSLMESLNNHQGLGLAANQVGLTYRMFVMNRITQNKVWCLINPVITDRSKNIVRFKEGCLSFPGLFLTIGRPDWVEVEFQAANGKKMNERYTGLEATVVLHEMDHLNGICFTDIVSPIKLDMAKRKVAANQRKIKKNRAA